MSSCQMPLEVLVNVGLTQGAPLGPVYFLFIELDVSKNFLRRYI